MGDEFYVDCKRIPAARDPYLSFGMPLVDLGIFRRLWKRFCRKHPRILSGMCLAGMGELGHFGDWAQSIVLSPKP